MKNELAEKERQERDRRIEFKRNLLRRKILNEKVCKHSETSLCSFHATMPNNHAISPRNLSIVPQLEIEMNNSLGSSSSVSSAAFSPLERACTGIIKTELTSLESGEPFTEQDAKQNFTTTNVSDHILCSNSVNEVLKPVERHFETCAFTDQDVEKFLENTRSSVPIRGNSEFDNSSKFTFNCNDNKTKEIEISQSIKSNSNLLPFQSSDSAHSVSVCTSANTCSEMRKASTDKLEDHSAPPPVPSFMLPPAFTSISRKVQDEYFAHDLFTLSTNTTDATSMFSNTPVSSSPMNISIDESPPSYTNVFPFPIFSVTLLTTAIPRYRSHSHRYSTSSTPSLPDPVMNVLEEKIACPYSLRSDSIVGSSESLAASSTTHNVVNPRPNENSEATYSASGQYFEASKGGNSAISAFRNKSPISGLEKNIKYSNVTHYQSPSLCSVAPISTKTNIGMPQLFLFSQDLSPDRSLCADKLCIDAPNHSKNRENHLNISRKESQEIFWDIIIPSRSPSDSDSDDCSGGSNNTILTKNTNTHQQQRYPKSRQRTGNQFLRKRKSEVSRTLTKSLNYNSIPDYLSFESPVFEYNDIAWKLTFGANGPSLANTTYFFHLDHTSLNPAQIAAACKIVACEFRLHGKNATNFSRTCAVTPQLNLHRYGFSTYIDRETLTRYLMPRDSSESDGFKIMTSVSFTTANS